MVEDKRFNGTQIKKDGIHQDLKKFKEFEG
jgi:hypothetical protein